MHPTTEYIHYLIAVKLAGQATDAELQQLDELLKTNDAAKQQWKNAVEGISTEDIENRFNKIDEWNWKDINEIQPKSHRRKIAWSVLLAAAVISAVVVSISIFKAPSPPQKTGISQATTSRNIQLQLSNGQVYTLTGDSTSEQLDVGVLQNSAKTLTYKIDNATGNEAVLTAMNSLRVPVGQDYKIVLSDGSKIWLNSQTEIKFPFKFQKSSREIFINGEAYLEVAKDAARPFLVHAANSTIRVLGTSFNVNTYDSAVTRVALVEGSVRLVTQSAETNITPGYEAVYKNQKVSIAKFDEDIALAWKSGRLYFENATIQEISGVLPRWFGVEVQFDSPALMTETFTGVVNRKMPITVFLDKLTKITGAKYYFDKKGVLHIK
ncbi:FecR family protein [Chitinophaga sp. S165]|uniref:FecR family protein n=1 Tax=Chitinophaga sp. S165 TaxID=2135462 RepID=UPI000D7158E3|nr:FecR domain-containing protein [Chitinophaga sp. S165]PWV55543.1 FecR family protein [Chitinophaga sp. S165]